MQRTIAAFFILLWLATAALAQRSVVVPATTNTIFFGATTTISRIITGKAGQSIYITNLSSHPTSTAVLTLSYGTGTNCGTNTVNWYGPATFQAGENVYVGTGNGAVAVIPPGVDVCITIATATAPGWLSYSQF